MYEVFPEPRFLEPWVSLEKSHNIITGLIPNQDFLGMMGYISWKEAGFGGKETTLLPDPKWSENFFFFFKSRLTGFWKPRSCIPTYLFITDQVKHSFSIKQNTYTVQNHWSSWGLSTLTGTGLSPGICAEAHPVAALHTQPSWWLSQNISARKKKTGFRTSERP